MAASISIRRSSASSFPRPLEQSRYDPADENPGEDEQRHGNQEGDAEGEAGERGHGISIVAGNAAGMTDPDARDPEGRLSSGKAVSAALLLAAVVFAALAVFLWVVFSRACGGPSI